NELTEAELLQGVRERTLKTEVVPMFCGTAFKNKGVQAMLDGVGHLLPSPVDVPAIKGVDVDDENKELIRESSDKAPFSALAFKIMRSEEHTSELQSRENLVCRLLLE